MNPLITFLKLQKPEWENYLSLLEQWHQLQESNTEENITNVEVEENRIGHNPNLSSSIEINKLSSEKLLEEINELEMELQEEIRLNSKLASALGACTDCFGKNKACISCMGKGKPGYFIPNRNLFKLYVLPALKTYNTQFN